MKLPQYVTELETFPFLTQVRCLAALIVVCHHIELFKSLSGHPNLWSVMFVQSMGPAGVDLFFVISGFLITYLLLAEQQKKGTITVSKFYVRRILRIWPLYYLLVFLGFVVLPAVLDVAAFNSQPMMDWTKNFNSNFLALLTVYCLLIPNIGVAFFASPLGISHLWSIGVEEQFYLFWPWLLKFGRQKAWVLMVGVIALKFCATLAIIAWKQQVTDPAEAQLSQHITDLANHFRIEMMASGGLAACWFVKRGKCMPAWITHPASQLVSLSVVVAGLAFPNVFIETILALGFSHIILANVSTQRKPGTIGLFVNYLGRVSYGIYMYHFIVLLMVMQIIEKKNHSLPCYDFVVYFFSITATIVVSAVSYHFFERPFLKLKEKFTLLSAS